MSSMQKNKTAYIHLYDHHDPIWNKAFEEHFETMDGEVVRSYAEREEMQFDRWLDILPGTDAVCQLETTADLAKYLERNPDRLEGMKALVASGNLELLGGGTTIIDFSTVHGESVYRNYLYSFKWLQETFGVRPRIADCNDTFGMSAQVPQVFTQFGMPWLCQFSRCFDNEPEGVELPQYGIHPHRPYWRGLDGSVICIKRDFEEHGRPQERAFVNYQYSPCPVCRGEGCRFCEYSGMDRHAEQGAASLDGQFGELVRSGDHAGRYVSHTEETVRTRTFLPDLARLAEKHGLDLKYLSYEDIRTTWAEPYLDAIRTGTVPDEEIDARPDATPISSTCYIIRGILKRANREAEHLLLAAEKFAALASRSGFTYPRHAFERQWTLMNTLQAHDALTGNHPDGPFREIRKFQRNVCGTAGKHLLAACRHIAARVATDNGSDAVTVTVFNPLNWDVPVRDVEIIIPADDLPARTGSDGISDWELHDADGTACDVISWERIAVERGPVKTAVYRLTAQVRDLPALGYAVFRCVPSYAGAPQETGDGPEQLTTTDAEMMGLQATTRVASTGRTATAGLAPVTDGRIANDRYEITFNDRGVTGITDTVLGTTVAGPGALDLVAEDDIGTYWDRLVAFDKRVNLCDHADMRVEAYAGRMSRLVITGTLPGPMPWDIPGTWSRPIYKPGNILIREVSSDEVYCGINRLAWTHEITLLPGTGRVDIKTTIDCDSENIRLSVPLDFGFTTPDDLAWYEIPYGMVERPSYEPRIGVHLGPDGPWAAVHWAAAENRKDGYTCGVLNRGVPAHEFRNGTMTLHLHRSPCLRPWGARALATSRVTDPLGRDTGTQTYEYALVSRRGGVAEARMTHLGYAFNAQFPAVVARPGKGAAPSLPARHSFLTNTAENVIIPVVKKAENGEDLVLRMTEVYGLPAEDTLAGVTVTAETDPMEEQDTPVDGKLRFRPFEIKTVRTRER